MYSFSLNKNPYGSLVYALPHPCPSKRNHKNLRLRMLKRNRRRAQLKEASERQRKRVIEMKNLELYMENQNMIEENEKLRKQAMFLHKENQALLYKLQKKLAEQNNNKTNN